MDRRGYFDKVRGADVNKGIKRPAKATIRAVTTLVVLLLLLLVATPAAAGLGFTGNFYRYGFVLERGTTSEGIEAYVTIINTDAQPVNVKMKTETPPGVTITMPETDFALEPNVQKRLDVVVEVSPAAKLGEYTLTVSAESYREGSGIMVAGGGMQQATLKIVKPQANRLPIIGGVIGGMVIFVGALILILKKTRWFRVSRRKA